MKPFSIAFFVFDLILDLCTYASPDVKDTIVNISPDSAKNTYSPNYPKIFKFEYPKALALYKSNARRFDSICHIYDVDTSLAVSIVFPEFIRYQYYQDVFEILSLEMVYIKLGKKYIDFSIGPMQMKPSFAEDLENCLRASAKLSAKYKLLLRYHSVLETEIRKERLDRLKALDFQMVYLCLFCDVVSSCFHNIASKPIGERIKFYAAAYNSDFHASEAKIDEQIKHHCFPDGKNSIFAQYSYSEVALHFYQNFYSKK
jgi:hypothetical protein